MIVIATRLDSNRKAIMFNGFDDKVLLFILIVYMVNL